MRLVFSGPSVKHSQSAYGFLSIIFEMLEVRGVRLSQQHYSTTHRVASRQGVREHLFSCCDSVHGGGVVGL